MQNVQLQRFRWLLPLMVFVVAGLLIGVTVGYLMWSPGASDFGVVSSSKEATRTVRVSDVSFMFPSVTIAKAGADSSLTISLTNLRGYVMYVAVSLALVRNSGIDSDTISALTSGSYTVTLAAYGSTSDTINLKPTSTGYAFFDLMANGNLAGTIAVYVVSS
jgi:hypothetical protein